MDYSDIYKELVAQRDEMLRRVQNLSEDIHNRDEPYSADFAEQAVELEDLDVLFELDKESRARLSRINNALMRLENNEYDICSRCGNTIPEARLLAVPHTELCILCAEAEEEEEEE